MEANEVAPAALGPDWLILREELNVRAPAGYFVLSLLWGCTYPSNEEIDVACDQVEALGDEKLLQFFVRELHRLLERNERMSERQQRRIRGAYMNSALKVLRAHGRIAPCSEPRPRRSRPRTHRPRAGRGTRCARAPDRPRPSHDGDPHLARILRRRP